METRFSRNGHPTTKVLLIEDDETIRETVSIALRDEGFEVTCFNDGLTAWEALYRLELDNQPEGKPFPFHLIILDLVLPRMDGWRICQFIRARQNSVPILILSCRDSEDDKVLGLNIGADDYLSKPFSLRELIARCRCLLRSHLYLLSQPVVLSFGDIRLYPEEYRVQVRGQEITLPLLEFRLLHTLLRRPQQVRTQRDLIREVWGTDPRIHPKTLAAYVNRLREKIELNPRRPNYIKTVRGIGYCLGTVDNLIKPNILTKSQSN